MSDPLRRVTAMSSLRVVPIYTTDAIEYIDRHHSHLPPPERVFYASAVHDENGLRCVAALARPKSRELQAQGYAEVVRVASDGQAEHAASMALGALLRAARALGWAKFVSYTLLGEAGTIYRATGWWPVAITRPDREWNCPSRPREEAAQSGSKVRWVTGGQALTNEYIATCFALGVKHVAEDPSSDEAKAFRREMERLHDVMVKVQRDTGKVPIPPRPVEALPLFIARDEDNRDARYAAGDDA